jgi:hypothetical protein
VELFPSEQVVGIFRGFREGGMEFHADLVLPYRNDFQSIPMHGQFLLVQLETPKEAVLGRIASFSSEGKLSFGSGEEFNIRAVREGRAVPEDLREQYLKYRVNIRVLGVLRNGADDKLTFVASHRRLPHVGSAVALPSREVLCEIAGHNEEGAEVGHFALGEYVYASGSDKLEVQNWMQVKEPEVLVKFPIGGLVSRRSFIFARAGFGKSNLNKLLFSKLYAETPTVEKRNSKKVPVGTIIFDPDGEYFWPDDKGRPGLCDVPELEDKIVVFTDRRGPSDFYQSFVADGIKLDIRRLNPSDVIGIALSPERQDQQNVRKLRGLSGSRWEELVNLVERSGNQTPLDDVCRILDLDKAKQEAEATAARSNMTSIVKSVHDKSSQLMDKLLRALSEGKLCIVDVSRMRGGQSLILSGLILRKIFDRNQEEFTARDPKTIPTIAVVEEAQAVLNERATAAEPYIAWVKEGRKYDLGALLITQQPGSIPTDILSQGDNWFIFHLLSATDLNNVRKANAHFSEDLLSALLNEPIPGQGVFWSSVGGKPYPVAIRALSFEQMYRRRDENYDLAAVPTYAAKMKRDFQMELQAVASGTAEAQPSGNGAVAANTPGIAPPLTLEGLAPDDSSRDGEEPEEKPDVKETFENGAIQALRRNEDLLAKIDNGGAAWGSVKAFLKENLPTTLEDRERDQLAYALVPKALNEILGPQDEAWHSFRNEQRDYKTYVRTGRNPERG